MQRRKHSSVSSISSNWLRCALAALIFTFAATADVIVKSVVDDQGHDANNPLIWIEHKCAGHLGKTTQNHVLPQIIIASAFTVPSQFFLDVQPASQIAVSPESRESAVPASPPSNLRC
jgi:hypothetical protein